MNLTHKILLLFSFTLLTACSYQGSIDLPGLYRINIQQGNVIDQHLLDRLKPGMDKNQVEFILGTPAFIDPFHTEQWEYFFSSARQSRDRRQRHMRLHFIDDELAYISGDVKVTDRDLSDPIRESRTVDVPLRTSRPGFFKRLINELPIVGNSEPRIIEGVLPEDEEQEDQADELAQADEEQENPGEEQAQAEE